MTNFERKALEGYGMDDGLENNYEFAALRGFGDEGLENNYNFAALKGFGSGSADQKAKMAWVRSFRGKGVCGGKGGKKQLKGRGIGTVLSLGLAGAKGLYKLIKFIKRKKAEKAAAKAAETPEGGRALIIDPEKRKRYITQLTSAAHLNGKQRAAMWPYSLEKAKARYSKRVSRLSPAVKKYLEEAGELEDSLIDAKTMRAAIKRANSALRQARSAQKQGEAYQRAKKRGLEYKTKRGEDDDLVYPDFAD